MGTVKPAGAVMISFRDMTFCPFWQACTKGSTCPRALTPEVVEAAEKWWGSSEDDGGPPIAQWARPPECYNAVAVKQN